MNAAFAIGRISDHPDGRKRILSSPDCHRMVCALFFFFSSFYLLILIFHC